MTRRRFIQWTSGGAMAGAVGLTFGPSARGDSQAVSATVRDRFWVWAHDAHCYDNSYGLPRNGRIAPVESAHYLGVPNVIMIRYGGKPATICHPRNSNLWHYARRHELAIARKDADFSERIIL